MENPVENYPENAHALPLFCSPFGVKHFVHNFPNAPYCDKKIRQKYILQSHLIFYIMVL